MDQKPIIAILQGDATGVGPEIVARLAVNGFFSRYCRPILIGDARVFEMGLKIIGTTTPYSSITAIDEADWGKGMPILDLKNIDPQKITMGEVNPECGAACVEMIKIGVELFKQGKIDGICFAPFNKSAMKLGGSPAPSELELMAMLFNITARFGEINMVDDVWTTRVTSHIPLSCVAEELSVAKIVDSIILANDTLISAGIEHPRIGVSALNPHAGEHGLCGAEEIELIVPAVKQAIATGIQASGPYSSDILFIKAFNREFDAAVTMFHDQGQIALKLRGFEQGITIGGGFPLPVTTCAHGTAHDIAGKCIAKTTSFENAVVMVSRMASNTVNEGRRE